MSIEMLDSKQHSDILAKAINEKVAGTTAELATPSIDDAQFELCTPSLPFNAVLDSAANTCMPKCEEAKETRTPLQVYYDVLANSLSKHQVFMQAQKTLKDVPEWLDKFKQDNCLNHDADSEDDKLAKKLLLSDELLSMDSLQSLLTSETTELSNLESALQMPFELCDQIQDALTFNLDELKERVTEVSKAVETQTRNINMMSKTDKRSQLQHVDEEKLDKAHFLLDTMLKVDK